jgi:hypothetical protein
MTLAVPHFQTGALRNSGTGSNFAASAKFVASPENDAHPALCKTGTGSNCRFLAIRCLSPFCPHPKSSVLPPAIFMPRYEPQVHHLLYPNRPPRTGRVKQTAGRQEKTGLTLSPVMVESKKKFLPTRHGESPRVGYFFLGAF